MIAYAYRQIRNHWVVYRIKEQTFVKWFKTEAGARICTQLLNEGGFS